MLEQTKTTENTDYCGNLGWQGRQSQSPRVVEFLREPMWRVEWKRGALGRDPDLISLKALERTLWQSAVQGAFPCHHFFLLTQHILIIKSNFLRTNKG